jgi:hypothetical protein
MSNYPVFLNISEWLRVKKTAAKGLRQHRFKLLDKFYRRNIARNFSNMTFDYAIYYTGVSAFYSMLCLRGVDAKKKIIYYHDRNSAAFSTYQYYNQIVADHIMKDNGLKTVSAESFEKQFQAGS